MSKVIMSPEQEKYFDNLQYGVDETYKIAERCRKKGFDPRTYVEIPQAEDMASRVQQLLSFLEGRNTAQQKQIWKLESLFIKVCVQD